MYELASRRKSARNLTQLKEKVRVIKEEVSPRSFSRCQDNFDSFEDLDFFWMLLHFVFSYLR
ncbi:hypothetical protein Vi05172_g11956 [Venturia inaequalis]|nr:hypothetical protein Vi05172_g11956 [Venturia inaequalis]